jgi:hypothetical protein
LGNKPLPVFPDRCGEWPLHSLIVSHVRYGESYGSSTSRIRHFR